MTTLTELLKNPKVFNGLTSIMQADHLTVLVHNPHTNRLVYEDTDIAYRIEDTTELLSENWIALNE